MINLDIAIVGIDGRFPGANTVEAFWRNLRDGVESIQRFSDQALAEAGVSQRLVAHPDYVKAGAILDGIEYFDADFFGFTPKEATIMNPQQRLFLECAWEVLERAGYDTEQFPGRIGVYAGAATNYYLLARAADLQDEVSGLQIMIGNEPDYLTTHIAYKLNLTGPALTVQTACSTSLVAVHQACQSLLNHECDMALAGGVTILLPHLEGYLYVEGGINSPDGHCRAFDAKAQGTVPGNGVGIVLLKRLSDAIKAGDQILAVIKASAINNDGASKIGYTAPGLAGQANVIADALAMAEVNPETISYVETHGTGTPLGDPIEFSALAQVFRVSTERTGFCKLGALKTNIGHLGAAAGVSGLIKTVLALQHQCIPPTLHFTAANPKIDLANSPFTVNAELASWRSNGSPRRAGVSSFGVGGTNAHVIVEEAPALAASGPSRPWQLLMLSAKNSDALERMTENLSDCLQANPNINLADVAYTLQIGRRRFNQGRLLVCQSVTDALEALAQPAVEPVVTVSRRYATRPVVFMFSGQGAQHLDMGRELYQYETVFRQAVDECAEILRPHLGVDLRSVLFPADGDRAEAALRLNQTALTQPGLFVIEYALAQLWNSFGIAPQAMIGHSIGEYVAACLAGVFSLPDALMVVAARGRLMQALPAGSMLAVAMSADAIQPYLNDALSLAAINAPGQSVVAGTTVAVAALESRLAELEVKSVRLPTSHAFHSAMLEPMLDPFAAIVSQAIRQPPKLPYLSNLSGDWIQATEATDPRYWTRHARQPVNFAAGLGKLAEHPEWILLEVGPGTTLANLAKQHPARAAEQTVLASLPHANDPRPAQQALLQTLGQLYLHGVDVDWPGFCRDERRRRVLLPTYPFQRQRHWVDTRPAADVNRQAADGKLPMELWFALPTWRQTQSANSLPQADTLPTALIFVDGQGVGLQLAERLRPQGSAVVTVAIGPAFAQVTPSHYTVNPAHPPDYQALMRALHTNGQLPGSIMHLWQLGPSASPSILDRLDAIDGVYQRGFDSLLLLAQALGELGDGQARHMIAVSSQLHAVMGDEALDPEKAVLLGCCRVITQEYPLLSCRSVDIELPSEPQDGSGHEAIIGQLLDELNCAATDTVVAYRGRRRWAQHFDPVRLDAPRQDSAGLRRQGVYLITAGLGATGLHMAHYLAQAVDARLVLVDVKEAQASHTQVLQEQGAEFLALQADVTNLAQMRHAVAQAISRFGALHGVLHIPAAANDGLIQLKAIADTRRVLAPSITGTLVLEAALQGLTLDFFSLFGATTSISGGIGQVDECAANAFLDAYAHGRAHASPGIVTAIDWPLWQWDDHYEQSMAGFLNVQSQFREMRATFGITQEEAGEALLRILGSAQPQVVVSPRGIDSVLEQQRNLTMENVAAQLQTRTTLAPGTDAKPPNFEPPLDELETLIATVWQEVFGIVHIGRRDNFFDLGGHSLLSIQLISRLRNVLQLPDIALSLLFEAPTVAALATAIRATRRVSEPDLEALASDGDSEIATLLAEIEGMSEEEILAALARE